MAVGCQRSDRRSTVVTTPPGVAVPDVGPVQGFIVSTVMVGGAAPKSHRPFVGGVHTVVMNVAAT